MIDRSQVRTATLEAGAAEEGRRPVTLVGYDGSELARAALTYAARRARPDELLLIAYAVTGPADLLDTPWYDQEFEDVRAHATTVLEEVELPAGVECDARMIEGPPAVALAALARERDAGCIVVGSHAFGRLRAALGSLSHALLQEADRPVIVIPRGALAPSRERPPVAVVGYDGSAAARGALRLALRRMGPDGRVVAVHGYAAPSDWLGGPSYDRAVAARQAHGRALLDALEQELDLGPRLETDLLEGPAAEALLRAAAARRADEILVGSRGLGRFRGALGSVSHAVLYEADRPVVVVPAPALDGEA